MPKAKSKPKKKATKKTAKKRKRVSKSKYVTVCPKCKSVDVVQDKSVLQQTGALPPVYICNNCGHSGTAFPEVQLSELEKFEKQVDKRHLRKISKDNTPLIDTSYGLFEVRFWWKVISPIVFLLGVIFLLWNTLFGSVVMLLGLIMMYITYFKKKKLR